MERSRSYHGCLPSDRGICFQNPQECSIKMTLHICSGFRHTVQHVGSLEELRILHLQKHALRRLSASPSIPKSQSGTPEAWATRKIRLDLCSQIGLLAKPYIRAPSPSSRRQALLVLDSRAAMLVGSKKQNAYLHDLLSCPRVGSPGSGLTRKESYPLAETNKRFFCPLPQARLKRPD